MFIEAFVMRPWLKRMLPEDEIDQSVHACNRNGMHTMAAPGEMLKTKEVTPETALFQHD